MLINFQESSAVDSSPNKKLVNIRMYTLRVKKTVPLFTAYNFRNIVPNLAQITFSSCWTSCHNFYESTLENSGAIWRI